ncbi:MAG: P-loop NTPase [Cyanobacteria bacterium P01_E01_bin.42]
MPKIVAIHSFRHGTGKSTLTANLTVSIARAGYRVGAIDADVELMDRSQFPGIYSCFGLQKSQHLGDYLQGRATLAEIGQEIDKKIWSLPQTNSTTGSIYLFSHDISRQGRINCPEFSDIKILSALLDKIVEEFNLDYLFLDIHPGLNETTLPLLALCDLLCLLLGLERADFQGTAVTLDIAKRLEIPQTFLSLARVPPDIDLTWFGEQVALAYDTSVVGVLPKLDSLSDDRRQDNIFALSDRDSPYASEFQKIVARVVEEQEFVGIPRQERQIGMGLNLLDLLELPETERHLLKSTLRQRASTFEQILQQAGLEPDALRSVLKDLLARGLLKQVERNGEVYYRPYLTPKQGRKLNSRIWDALSEPETSGE